MSLRRLAPYVVTTLLVGGLLSAPSAIAGPRHAAQPDPAAATIGHLAYITQAQTVKIAAVKANGATSSVKTVGPITKPKSKQFVQVTLLVASGDGDWIAWTENLMKQHKGGPAFIRAVLVLRHVTNGDMFHLDTDQVPVGFAGDRLVTEDGDLTRLVDLSPTPHLVKVDDHQFPLAAYPKGVVDTTFSEAPPGPSDTQRLRLTTFSGSHTVLHSYVLAPDDARNPDLGWVSGDAKHLVIERGDHTDFGGIGPSSLADEFGLGSSHTRHQLGHYGTAKAAWRMNSVSFSGGSDKVWVVWERAVEAGATSVVAKYENGKWHTAMSDGIAVAGNHDGYVVVQPGKWVSVGVEAPDFDTVPTADASLLHGGATHVLHAEGTTFVWVS
jgi:hypothetical protein